MGEIKKDAKHPFGTPAVLGLDVSTFPLHLLLK